MRNGRSSRSGFAGALAVALLALAACGEEAGPGGTPAPAAPALEPVPLRERARFAFERMTRGPVPSSGALRIPHLHAQNLRHAIQDLRAMREETLDLLADPEIVDRYTRPRLGPMTPETNPRLGALWFPWENVLELLREMHPVPLDLVRAWTEPALGAENLQLRRKAVRVLAAAHEERTAGLLLRFLERDPEDREVAATAIPALVALGAPWRERAFLAVLGSSASLTWDRIPDLVEDVEEARDALAWWALLAETSGPVIPSPLGDVLRPVWQPLRGWLEETGAGFRPSAGPGPGVIPAEALDAGGLRAVPLLDSSVVPPSQTLLCGAPSAARARCRLALAGHEAHLLALLADSAAADPAVRAVAAACEAVPADAPTAAELRAALEEDFARLEAGGGPGGHPETLRRFDRLAAAAGEAAAELGWRLVRSAAAAGPAHAALVDALHDRLLEIDPEGLVARVLDLAASADGADLLLAERFMRRGRDLRYIPAAERALARSPAAWREAWRRLLVWLYSAEGVDAAAVEAFVPRLARWITEVPDARLAALAPALLEFGPAGDEAFARGLAGPRAAPYVQALNLHRGRVSLAVAEALLARLDAATPTPERHAILAAAYRTAPAEASPLLAAARLRLDPAVRDEVDPVLLVLRHRAPAP